MTNYCEATHENAPVGCYGWPNHVGNHWRYASEKDKDHELTERMRSEVWEWPNEAAPVQEAEPEAFTSEELAVLAVLVLNVEKFYPELGPKILRMKEALSAA